MTPYDPCRKLVSLIYAILALSLALCALAADNNYKLEGRITDLFGNVIPGAKVVAFDSSNREIGEVTSDDEGRYFFRVLPEVTNRLRISYDGFTTVEYPLSLSLDGKRRLDVGLHLIDLADSPGCRLRGQLLCTDPKDTVANIRIKGIGAFDPNLTFAIRSDSDGHFEVDIEEAAEYIVFAQAPDFPLRPIGVHCVGDMLIEVKLLLAPDGTDLLDSACATDTDRHGEADEHRQSY